MSAQVLKVIPLWGKGESTRSGPLELDACPFGSVLSVSSQLIVCPLGTGQSIVVINYERSAFYFEIDSDDDDEDTCGFIRAISRFRAFETRENYCGSESGSGSLISFISLCV